jgi:uncharacterized membrane protein HdeD (DUF308 family)
MLDSSLETLLLGGFLTIGGLFLIVFHKQIRERSENWNERAPWFLKWSPQGGRIFTVMIIMFGALLIYVGVAQVLRLFIQQ